ncbi:hypothetical protein PX554_10365 [Sphingomonas sp. H39-1-10]|uniref:hypothetical protein n=1 Tax=Sphingomonas pollutisoli TaxID=3030829 RepID=UPI0023B95686|nr:hypothetical protein [Sphingomonas pollutisoli]MDF0488534.1 hypothetical protein [Sphingomonas pollutisoli]
MATHARSQETVGASPYVLALRHALRDGTMRTVAEFDIGALRVELRVGQDSLWALVRRPNAGGLAIRAAYPGGPFECSQVRADDGEIVKLRLNSALGEHVVSFRTHDDALQSLRITAELTPSTPILVPFMPRDLYPLDHVDDPLGAVGQVEAGQRGLNVGVVYFHIDDPAFGSVLYFQNLTAMNPYYRATKTAPDSAVGGVWPELGYLPPTPAQSGTPPIDALPAGKRVTMSDAILVFRHDAAPHERESARRFLQMLGVAYKQLALPGTDYRDWVGRAEKTLRDLDEAPAATIRHYGHRYIHPYTGAEYPDVMVQMSIVSALHDWSKWTGEDVPLKRAFQAALDKFYDPKLRTLRRYLPNVGKDKNADAVDSWYLYHPLLNLSNLALDGDDHARTLFLDSIDYAIKAARHFDYRWPVQYDLTDFSVITDVADADGRGQTDVGGVYAWVMLQAFQLTDDKRFLDEARAALDAAMGLRFNINYQANLTAWGAAACMRLWRITNAPIYLEQSYVYLGSFFQNCEIWESQLELAVHYRNFLGVTCLQDAPYMAIYECFESFAAFERYLDDSGPELDPAVRMLIAEYCKYALDRAWYYYPDVLPREAISPEQRAGNGHIDPKLSFPLEDLYPDGQLAGQVGQEVYGAGAAFIFATRAFTHVEDAPFLLFCDHLLRAIERTGDRALTLTLDGGETCTAALSLVRRKRRTLTKSRVATIGGDTVRAHASSPDRIDYRVPANGRLVITWE